MEGWVCYFGVIKCILSDEGANYMSALFSMFTKFGMLFDRSRKMP